MSEQAEFMKTVRERVTGVQTRASARLGALNDDAKRVFDGLVEKGQQSQREMSERLQKAGGGEYRSRMDQLTRKVKDAQGRAVSFVDATSRDRAAAVAENLRRFAARLDQLAHKTVGTPSPSTQNVVH